MLIRSFVSPVSGWSGNEETTMEIMTFKFETNKYRLLLASEKQNSGQ